MALTDLQLKQASPKERDWKLSDGGGLYILVRPNGAKLWRMKYRQHGKEKKLAFGNYPQVGLREARLMRDDARVEIGRAWYGATSLSKSSKTTEVCGVPGTAQSPAVGLTA